MIDACIVYNSNSMERIARQSEQCNVWDTLVLVGSESIRAGKDLVN